MKIRLLVLVLFIANAVNSQSYKYAHYCLDSLTSEAFGGRGYQDEGDKKAANFIESELIINNVKSINNNPYQQKFNLKINNIEEAKLKFYSKDSSYLKLGEEFLIFGSSPSTELVIQNEKPILIELNNVKSIGKIEKYRGKVLLFDLKTSNMGSVTGFLRALDQDNIIPKLALVQNCGKMQYPLGYRVYKFPVVEFRDKVIKKKIDYLEISIKANWQENYSTQNVWAMVEGTKYKDSLYVFTAHYDHLGKIGKDCYFPGANDNASGVSVLLDLSKYYAQNPSDYSIVFIFTSAEEMGLLGAKYAAENPLIDLSKVKFLLNLDMCGTGSGGIALINGEKEIKASLQIQKINDDKLYFNQIRIGGESCNSDHCPFVQRGVPAFFIFTFGCEYNEYHTIYDNGKGLSFTKHIDLCNILKNFIETYNR